MGRVSVNKIFSIVIIICCILYIGAIFNINIARSQKDDYMYLLSSESISICNVKADNQANVNLGGFSNIVREMLKDGFSISSKVCTKDSIDILLKGEDYTARLFYQSNGELLVVSSPYEKSSVPLTYINGGS